MLLSFFACALTGILTTSQTFFGVITTIVVLCLFIDLSNFIYKILDGFKMLITSLSDRKIKIISRDIERRIEVLKPIVGLYIDSIKEKNLELYNEGVALLDDIGLMGIKIKGKVKDLKSQITKLFNFCSHTEEQAMAPLYTFMFCIVVFCCDEISSITNGVIVSNIIFFLTVFSYIFWIEVWYCYCKRTQPNNILFCKKKTKRSNYKIFKILHRIMINILLLVFIVFIFFIANLFCTWNSALYSVMLLFIFLLFIIFFHIYHADIFLVKKENYSKVFIFSHFGCILFLSFFYTLILICLNLFDEEFIYLDLFLNSNILKYSVIFFALVNGLILPLCAPLSRYICYQRYIDNKIQDIKNDSINYSFDIVLKYKEKVEDFRKRIDDNHL